MEEYTDALYRSLSEYKLKQKVQRASGKIIVENGQLMLSGEEEAFAFRIGVFAPKAAEGAVEAVKKELSEIVGLQTVKEYVLSLEDNFKMQQLRKEKGLKADSPSMHMIFTGNPGTGKTTVARIVSRYLKAIGVLAGGQLVEGEGGLTAAAFLAGGVAERIDGEVARYAAQKCAEAPRPFGRYGAPQAQKGVVDAFLGIPLIG